MPPIAETRKDRSQTQVVAEAPAGFQGLGDPLTKRRIDRELVDRELVESRERAQILVMAGMVFANGNRVVKPAQMVTEETLIEVRGKSCPYVSRGGWKLEAALDSFQIEVEDARCLDLGSSTGGFTDLLLQRGARSVTAVDVGKGQLHWRLRQDERVEVREKTNARYLKKEDFSEGFDFLTGDLSFIGLNIILPAAFPLAKPGGQAVFLVKPQFEAGKGKVGRKGVVRDPEIHREVLLRVLCQTYGDTDFVPTGLVVSPIKGPAGNIEYLARFQRASLGAEFDIESRVEEVLSKVREGQLD